MLIYLSSIISKGEFGFGTVPRGQLREGLRMETVAEAALFWERRFLAFWLEILSVTDSLPPLL